MSRWDKLTWATLFVIVVCLLVELGLAFFADAFEWTLVLDDLPLLRLSGLSALCLGAFWALRATFQAYTIPARTSWWEPGLEPDAGSLSWDEVYKLVAFDQSLDPLAVPPRIRWGWWRRRLWIQVALYLLIWGVVLSAIDLIRDPSPRGFLRDAATPGLSRQVATAIGNPTAYLALVVGAATIFFTFRQLRAKVRADSRQQWIIQARTLLGEVVALIDAHKDLRAANRYQQAEEIWRKLNPARLQLELMLNPSEKDHRLLLYLIQQFATWRLPLQQSQDAKIVRCSIAGVDVVPRVAEVEIDPKWKGIIEADDRAELVSYILRLAHVVLKREWERVKHTR